MLLTREYRLRNTICDGARLGAAGSRPNNSRIACICYISSIVPRRGGSTPAALHIPTALSVRSTAAFHPLRTLIRPNLIRLALSPADLSGNVRRSGHGPAGGRLAPMGTGTPGSANGSLAQSPPADRRIPVRHHRAALFRGFAIFGLVREVLQFVHQFLNCHQRSAVADAACKRTQYTASARNSAAVSMRFPLFRGRVQRIQFRVD